MNMRDELAAADVATQVTNRIFGCGLTLAAIMGRPDLSDEVTRRLVDVIEELDTTIVAIRRAVFAAFVAAERDAQSEVLGPPVALAVASGPIAEGRAA